MSLFGAIAALLLGVAIESPITAQEQAVLKELDDEKWLKVRDLAEKLVVEKPSSFVGAWALARVHHDLEGNHPRALAWVRRAKRLVGKHEPDLLKRIFVEEYSILSEMNASQEALDVLEEFKEHFGDPPRGYRLWPLIKLERFEEAKALSQVMAASNDLDERIDGYNGMLSVAFEEHDREATYVWSIDAMKVAQDRSCVIVRNAAASAFTALRLEEAIDLAVKTQKLKVPCNDQIETMMAELYLLTGQFQQAVSALEDARKRFLQRRLRPMFALTRRAVLGELLEVVGKPEEAFRLAEDLYRQQQRMGVMSSSPKIEQLGRALRYWGALEGRLTQLSDAASYSRFPIGPTAQSSEQLRLMASRWEVRRALLTLLSEPGRLVLMARPNLAEPADWASWRIGDLIDIVGTGVMRGAIARARRDDAKSPEASPYLDSLEGEVALRERNWEQSAQLADKALADFKRINALWRWRTQAYRAEALWRLGKRDQSRLDYQEVLQNWPTIFRLMRLPLPAKVADDGSALAQDVRKRLARSDRFRIEERAPFQLTVLSSGKSVDICLADESGVRFACAQGDEATKVLDDFHAAAFGAKISLTQSDLKSLDGSPVRVGADQVLEKLMKP